MRTIGVKRKIELKNIVGQFPGFSGGWYLIDYIPKNSDAGSKSLIQYKQGNRNVVKKWNGYALKRIEALNIHFDYIIRALGSKELHSNDCKTMDEFGNMLARLIGGAYIPQLIRKNRTSGPMHGLNERCRKLASRNLYQVNPFIQPVKPFNILILDDIVTTGATIDAIRTALRDAFPLASIYFFVFGRTASKCRGTKRCARGV